MVEHSIPARYISFHDDMAAFFSIENFPKLHACNPNFRLDILICYNRPKLRFCSLISDTKTCFRTSTLLLSK